MRPPFIGQIISFKANRTPRNVQDQLQRGKACLTCRRKKMKCDGIRPVCTPCKRRNISDDCEYDLSTPSRSKLLEENLARLQARIRELESPSEKATATDEQPVEAMDVELPPSNDPSPGSDNTSERASSESAPKSEESHETSSCGRWWERQWPPSDVASMLIQHFLPNSHQLAGPGFGMSISRFLCSFSDGNSPCLFNSVFLWALHLSRAKDIENREEVYLQRALTAFRDFPQMAEEHASNPAFLSESILHTLQAGVLIAQYLYSQSRASEARQQSQATASLALKYGFHRLSPSAIQDSTVSISSPSAVPFHDLAPPRNVLEWGERVNIFWAVYIVDRTWNICNDLNTWEDDPFGGVRIDTPWPLDLHQYDLASAFPPGEATIEKFLAGNPPANGVDDSSFAAMRVKASALYSRAAELHLAMRASYPDETNPLATHILSKQATFHSRIVQEFASTLPSLDAIESIESSDSRRTFAVVYCLMNGTLMLLYQKLAQAGEPEAARICLHAADEVARVFEKRDGSSLGLLDPVLGTVGIKLAEVYIDELQRTRGIPDSPAKQEHIAYVDTCLDRLHFATVEGSGYPVYERLCPQIHAILRKRYE